MPTSNDIIRVAQGELGIKERPAGSNKVKYNTDYYSSPVRGDWYPWCCVFVWWVFQRAGASSLFFGGKKTAYCPTALSWFKQQGQFVTGAYQPGDLVFFDFSGKKQIAGHIGIVESVTESGNLIVLEGNTSITSDDNGGCVMRRERAASLIIGAGRPAYAPDTPDTGTTRLYFGEEITPQLGYSGKTHRIDTASVPETPGIELYIERGSLIITPSVQGDIILTSSRAGAPASLEFSVVLDSYLGQQGGFHEGDCVRLSVDGKGLFFGYVFTKERTREGLIAVTCYDQLRYLKNKDTIVASGITASQLLRMIASDYSLHLGEIAGTGHVLESIIEDKQTLFDMLTSALHETYLATGELFVLYDDFGALTLKNVKDLRLETLIDSDTAEDFDYTSSINAQTYNKIKLVYNAKDALTSETITAQSDDNISTWGTLQLYENLKDTLGATQRAEALLQLYNRKTRSLTIKNMLGDTQVRAGSVLPCMLGLGDIVVSNFMLAQKVIHRFGSGGHFMTLTLTGGDFIA